MEDYNSMYIPAQKPPTPPPKDGIMLNIASYPPLGQVTVFPTSSKSIDFTVLLEVNQQKANLDWETSISYLTPQGTWDELLLDQVKEDKCLVCVLPSLQVKDEKMSVLFFAGTLPIAPGATPSFTVKFRNATNQPWRCVRDHQGREDGAVIFQPLSHLDDASNDLGDYIKNLNQVFKVNSVISQSPGTLVWDLTYTVKPAGEEESSIENVTLGMPWGGYLRYVRICFKHLFNEHQITILDGSHCFVSGPRGLHLELENHH